MPISARIGSWSLALLLLVVAAGCGGNSFLGQRFDNFTAYYNTFYNARQSYEQGVQAMEGTTEPVDRTQYMPIFGAAARVGGNVSFQSAIDKGADILRDHPGSKWVDDALLLIGKSYFYQSNFVGAEQKFREVIDLETNLEDESRIWLAQTLIASGAYEDARDHLVTSLELEDVSDRFAPHLHLALGELYVRQGAFEEAASELATGLEDVRDHDIQAKASFLLGQVYETLGRYEDAVAAYRDVQSAHPRYALSYAANLSAVRIQGLYLDEAAALEELRRMERDGKNYNNRYELAYMRARIYQARGRTQEARSLYRDILRDPQAQLNDLRGRLHYALAELYRDDFDDYLVASAHFDTAQTALGSPSMGSQRGGADGTSQYASEAITDVQFQADVYRSFADVRRRVARMDSLLELGSLGPEAFAERILEIRQQRAEELAEQQRRAEQLQAERGFQDAASRMAIPDPNTPAAGSQATGEAGFLYHRDPIRIQEARMNFVSRWGDRPLVPDWRRSEAIAAAGSVESNGPLAGGDLEVADRLVQDTQLPPVDYSDVPRDSLSRAEMLTERANARYELANVLFLSMNRPDSAAVWYRMVVNEDAGEEVAQRAFYALAEVHRSLGDADAATRLYEQVLRDYPESDFAGRVREHLGIREVEASDSLTLALADYDAAFARWRRGSYGAALDSMVAVAAKHSRTDVAPKALLAAGRIYLEWANSDSMDVFGPLPLTVSDSVLEKAGLLSEEQPGATAPPGTSSSFEIDTAGETMPAPRPRLEPESNTLERDLEAPGDGAPPSDAPSDGQRLLSETRPADRQEEVLEADETARRAPPADTTAAGTPIRADTTEASGGAFASALAVTDSDTTGADGTFAEGLDPGTTDSTGLAAESDTTGAEGIFAEGLDPGPADSTGLAADTVAINRVFLTTLYARVREDYPSTPYADQASHLLDALEQRRRELEAAAVPPDALLAATAELGAVGSLAAGALVMPDSVDVPADTAGALVMPDSVDVAADTAGISRTGEASPVTVPAVEDRPDTTSETAQPAESSPDLSAEASPGAGPPPPMDAAVPSGEASLRGEGGIRPELGGFTIVLDMDVEREPMAALVRMHVVRGLRADVLETTSAGTTLYRAVIGQFPTVEAASAALDDIRDELDGPGQVAPLSGP